MNGFSERGWTGVVLSAVLGCVWNLAFAASTNGEDAARYVLKDLGTLGGTSSRASAINNSGYVTGDAETASGDIRAFVWSPTKGMSSLGTLGGEASHANDVNDSGVIVGEAVTGDGLTHAFIWDPDRGMKALPGPEGTTYSAAFAINDAGWAVGSVETEDGAHAVAWHGDETRILPRLPGKGYVQPLDVNDAGDVVGQIQTHEGTVDSAASHAFHFRRALTADSLATFRLLSHLNGSAAVAVNATGSAAGYVILNRRDVAAARFTWAEDPEPIDDGNAMYSTVCDINEAGVMCGSLIMTYTADEEACIWEDGRLVRLNDVTRMPANWHLLQATGINREGWIAGYGLAGDEERAFLLRPVEAAEDSDR